ncbi:MAG: DUF2804 domain-containing protein [Actinobacteria bacterium]|nr:DUF2804 domain-containing protein [Actinomycetota bacterium]MCG2819271.1 DUF2804 domain-containing protein [Actinomycetes bacterium]
MRRRKETPPRMVVDGQVAEYGVFKDPFREVNLLDVDLVIGKRHVPRLARDFRLKEWQHFGIIHEEYYFGMVIFDAKFMGVSFFYAFNRKTGEFFEHSRTSVGGPVRIARELWHGECYFRHIRYMMEFENRLDCNLHRIRVDIRGTRKKPRVEADIYLLEDIDRVEPLVVVSPVSENRPLYTHKVACPVEGVVKLGGERIVLDPENVVGLMDVQKTYYPYHTFWKWATFGGYDRQGRMIAMNACRNFISDDEKYNENCTWVDGRITLLPAARFDFDENALMDPWSVVTTDGGLDVTFQPSGERHGKTNIGVVMSNFHQPFGEFTGKMPGPDSEKIDIDGVFGLCEHHLARF